jgi:glycosyltransferase involved in cell wall biosynthesis
LVLDLTMSRVSYGETRRLEEDHRSATRRLYDYGDWLRLAIYERACVRGFDRSFVCSNRDRRRFRSNRVVVVPNGTLIPSNTLPLESDGRSVLFLGTLSYFPNVDALRVLVREIFPRVRRAVPNARLIVAGRSPGPEVLALHDGAAVVVRPDVAHVEGVYREATLSAVPLRTGSGTRLKILEAFALGRAVVSTTVGCEGLEVVDGEHLLIRDTPEAFAEACVALLRQPALRASLIGNARALVERKYSWDGVGEVLVRIVDELLQARH